MEISLADVLSSFGANQLCQKCLEFYESHDWSYEKMCDKEKDEIILKILKMFETDKQAIGSKERTTEWDDGWKENLDMFMNTRSLESLYPKFLRANHPVRFNREFIKPNNPNFERDYATLFVMWISSEYMRQFDNIYEFGCGSGFNIIPISKMFPSKYILGTDFSPSSVKLIKEISTTYGLNVDSSFFDMITPDFSLEIKPNSVVLTGGAIEQLAGKFHSLVDYWLQKKPELLIHIEPTIEFLDPDNLLDYLAIKFMRNRGYTQGFESYLHQLASAGKAEIIKEKRLYFGNFRIEGWNYIIWKPI